MGFFDKFKSKFERRGKERRVKKVETVTGTPNQSRQGRDGTGQAVTEKKTAPSIAKEARSAYRILSRPLVTEKSASLAHDGTYVFIVNPEVNKLDVKSAIYEVYGVHPVSVRIARRQGKVVRFGRFSGQRKEWKKAMVTMPAGKTLPIYE